MKLVRKYDIALSPHSLVTVCGVVYDAMVDRHWGPVLIFAAALLAQSRLKFDDVLLILNAGLIDLMLFS